MSSLQNCVWLDNFLSVSTCQCRIYKTGPNPTQNSESGCKSSALPQAMTQCQKAYKKKRNSVQIMLKDLYCKIMTKSLFHKILTYNHFFYYDKTLVFFLDVICANKTKMCQKAGQPPVCFFLPPFFLVNSKLTFKTRKCYWLLTTSVQPAAPWNK